MSTPVLPTPPVDGVEFKCQCADLWGHPAAQLLAGDALRPGGAQLTAAILDRADLPGGGRALDVGSGTGATLELLAERGFVGFGLDYSAALAAQASGRGAVSVGDAEALPYGRATFDVVTSECVLSAVPDKLDAVEGIHRVLRPGGRFVLSDVTLDGDLPEPLDTVIAWISCVAGALPRDGYTDLLRTRGFEVHLVDTRDDALASFLAKARRRLALLEGAVRVGIVPDPSETLGPELASLTDSAEVSASELTELGRLLLGQASDAVRRGELGYAAYVASRP